MSRNFSVPVASNTPRTFCQPPLTTFSSFAYGVMYSGNRSRVLIGIDWKAMPMLLLASLLRTARSAQHSAM